MATIAEQLTSLANTKTAIKEAIVAKGVAVADTDTFASYATKIGEIQSGGEIVDKTKFGVSIDDIFGNVDADGMYVAPTEPFVLDLSGVKSAGSSSFANKFTNSKCSGLFANDLVECGAACFSNSFTGCTSTSNNPFVVQANSLEEVSTQNAFYSAFSGMQYLDIRFGKLRIVSGDAAFSSFAVAANIQPDKAFPVLEEISGNGTFTSFRVAKRDDKIIFSKVKKIVGGASYSTTMNFYNALKYYFPRLVDASKYIVYGSGASELHFAKAHQEALEACEGYNYKWGGTNATLFFDLMLTIEVNGVVYDREYTIDNYTSWVDGDGNTVYTSDDSEPAVGTIVYSDQGLTQVGTVEAVA